MCVLHLRVEREEDVAEGVEQTLHRGEEGEHYPVHHTLDLTSKEEVLQPARR